MTVSAHFQLMTECLISAKIFDNSQRTAWHQNAVMHVIFLRFKSEFQTDLHSHQHGSLTCKQLFKHWSVLWCIITVWETRGPGTFSRTVTSGALLCHAPTHTHTPSQAFNTLTAQLVLACCLEKDSKVTGYSELGLVCFIARNTLFQRAAGNCSEVSDGWRWKEGYAHLCGNALTGSAIQEEFDDVQVVFLGSHVEWCEAILYQEQKCLEMCFIHILFHLNARLDHSTASDIQ